MTETDVRQLNVEISDLQETKELEEKQIAELQQEYEKLHTMLEQKNFARTKRQKNATNEEMLKNNSSSTRSRRRQETKHVLEYIHGGSEGSFFGACDYIKTYASPI